MRLAKVLRLKISASTAKTDSLTVAVRLRGRIQSVVELGEEVGDDLSFYQLSGLV